MNILVAGSEGSLMQAVIPFLLREGHTVRGVDSFFRHGRVERARDYELVEGDLTDYRVTEQACLGMEGIIQAAARIFGVRGFHKYPADILGYDVTLHHNILRAALACQISRAVYVSSSMVYERATKIPSEEGDVLSMPVPLTDYGLSKLVCERLSHAFARQYGLEYVVWRPFNIITPYERAEAEPGLSHVFADLIQKIVLDRRKSVPIFGDGEQVRCFTWIDDVARAIAAYSFSPQTANETYNLGNPVPITIKGLARKIFAKAVQRGILADTELEFEHTPIYSDDVRTRIPSIGKVQAELGWSPTIGLDEALDRCLDAALSSTHHES